MSPKERVFQSFPVLQTARFRLRQVGKQDVESLYRFFSDPEAMRYYGSPPQKSIEQTWAWLERMQKGFAQQQILRWAITRPEEDRVLGTCTMNNFFNNDRIAEIGYDLLPENWGKGIMQEAMEEVLRFGFVDVELHRIEAQIDEANVRSSNLLKRLGFQYEGTLRQRFLIEDRLEDETYYGILKDDWLAHTGQTRS